MSCQNSCNTFCCVKVFAFLQYCLKDYLFIYSTSNVFKIRKIVIGIKQKNEFSFCCNFHIQQKIYLIFFNLRKCDLFNFAHTKNDTSVILYPPCQGIVPWRVQCHGAQLHFTGLYGRGSISLQSSVTYQFVVLVLSWYTPF